ncbi:MAG: type 1 glutamine amidotransferase [Chitinophagaceae bacterium]|nr:type 1 glutamine amidotransferase [Chitinophagaceae bacterium]
MHIHYFQHVAFESPGYIRDWAEKNGCTESFTLFYGKYSLPDVHQIDWLVVMGGPMGVYDTGAYPWLEEEKKFILSCIAAGKTVIGICLGSQLIAAALGAAVYPNRQKEIGWFPIQLTAAGKSCYLFSHFPEIFTVLHWHGDTFDLPAGAVLLAESRACKNQAFIYGNKVLGLQFHFETTGSTLPLMIGHCRHELVKDKYVQDEEELKEGFFHIPAAHAWLNTLLNRLVGFNKV